MKKDNGREDGDSNVITNTRSTLGSTTRPSETICIHTIHQESFDRSIEREIEREEITQLYPSTENNIDKRQDVELR